MQHEQEKGFQCWVQISNEATLSEFREKLNPHFKFLGHVISCVK